MILKNPEFMVWAYISEFEGNVDAVGKLMFFCLGDAIRKGVKGPLDILLCIKSVRWDHKI